jgi:hypothetical protein
MNKMNKMNKTKSVMIRMTPECHGIFEAEAHSLGMRLTDFLHYLLVYYVHTESRETRIDKLIELMNSIELPEHFTHKEVYR